MSQAPTVVVVGNFDGVHLGHAWLFERARWLADGHGGHGGRGGRGGRVVAMPFVSHPLRNLRPGMAPPTVLHRDQRDALLRGARVDEIEWLDAEHVVKQTAERFIAEIVERYSPIAMVEGCNFRFGRGRAGDPPLLQRLGAQHGFEAVIEPLREVTLRDKTLAPISTSLVRWLLGHGRMADAQLCLGRPWQMQGEVVEGERRGRQIGVPTANLHTDPQMLPGDGVYAGWAEVGGQRHAAAISVGRKPTFAGSTRTAEVHLLDYGDPAGQSLYGTTLRVNVVRHLRDQWRFADVDGLLRQLDHDVAQIRALDDDGLLDPAALAMAGEA